MNDTMNEITAFSPFGGRLVLEEVKGAQERANVPENSIETKAGDDRSMYVYVPASGCPDAKQTQVVMFLRDGADEASAQAVMKEYGLDALAEKEHFVLAFPNPRQKRLERKGRGRHGLSLPLLMALPQGKGKVGGFIWNDLLYRRFSVSRRTAACDERAKAPECGGRAALGAPCGLQHPAGRRERAAGGLSLRRSRPRRRLFWKGERSDGSGRPAAGARGALHQPRKPKCAAHRVRAAVQRAGSGSVHGTCCSAKRGAGPTTPMGHIKSARILRPAALWHTSTTRASA